MLFKLLASLVFIFSILTPDAFAKEQEIIRIGSKRFSENYILAELLAQLLEEEGFKVERKFGLGGTMVAYQALKTGEIDLYPEYTGTVLEAIIKSSDRDESVIAPFLKNQGLLVLGEFGLDNTYCFVIRKDDAARWNIGSISDLSKHPHLIGGLTAEFQGRKDGWEPIKKVYGLSNRVKSIEVPLNYEALFNKKLDFSDAFSTDALIQKYNFLVLKDDKNFFPKYKALPIARADLPLEALEALDRLAGKIESETMIQLNAELLDGTSIPMVASEFLFEQGLSEQRLTQTDSLLKTGTNILSRSVDHLTLTLLAVLIATLVAVPLAIAIGPHQKLSQFVLGFTGILQTIPSIALLTFMIPFFGIGFKPAIVGLFIYSLLPILRNTHVAMTTIDPRLITAARGIGLYPIEILLSVKIPLAFPTILTGIRTATTLNIGTATLAAFIGAGGLGEPIVTGLSLNDTSLVLEGAIPAALLAIVVDLGFAWIHHKFSKDL